MGFNPIDHTIDPLTLESGTETTVAGDASGRITIVCLPEIWQPGFPDQGAG